MRFLANADELNGLFGGLVFETLQTEGTETVTITIYDGSGGLQGCQAESELSEDSLREDGCLVTQAVMEVEIATFGVEDLKEEWWEGIQGVPRQVFVAISINLVLPLFWLCGCISGCIRKKAGECRAGGDGEGRGEEEEKRGRREKRRKERKRREAEREADTQADTIEKGTARGEERTNPLAREREKERGRKKARAEKVSVRTKAAPSVAPAKVGGEDGSPSPPPGTLRPAGEAEEATATAGGRRQPPPPPLRPAKGPGPPGPPPGRLPRGAA